MAAPAQASESRQRSKCGYLYPAKVMREKGVLRPLAGSSADLGACSEPCGRSTRPFPTPGGQMKLRMVCPRAVAWCNRSRTGMLALAAAGALALTAATALAPGGPVVGAQAAVLSAAPTPAQVRTLPLPELLRGAAPAAVASPAVGVPATASPSVGLVSFLDGVFCTSRTRCWAVGGQAAGAGMGIANQVLRWNGTRGGRVSVPNP